MKLNEIFERIVVINLSINQDRKAKLTDHLKEIDIIDLEAIKWEKAIYGNWTPAPAWWGAGSGAWGCLMSHIRVAQDAIHDNVESYLVLEDDVVFHPKSEIILKNFINEVPSDWDQLYLGGQYLKRDPVQISPWVLKPYNINRTHAFALHKNIMPRFLRHVCHAPDYFDLKIDSKGEVEIHPNDFHVDHQLGRAHERDDWKVYCPIWWIAGQKEGNSDITGSMRNEMWWHWKAKGERLPFLYLDEQSSARERTLAKNNLHFGYNLRKETMVDKGLHAEISTEELGTWMKTISGEAVERWMLPGIEICNGFEHIIEEIKKIWRPGIWRLNEESLLKFSNYPFNGYGGGIPTHHR